MLFLILFIGFILVFSLVNCLNKDKAKVTPFSSRYLTSFENQVREQYLSKYKLALVYVVKLNRGSTSFYKIGITSKSVQERFAGLKDYSYEVVYTSRHLPSHQAFYAELIIKELLRSYKYTPAIPFSGSKTECFSKMIGIGDIEKVVGYSAKYSLYQNKPNQILKYK